MLRGELTVAVQINSVTSFSRLGVQQIEPEFLEEEIIQAEIESFSPEPYKLLAPLKIIIVGKNECEYIASHHESNVHASGDTPFEAIENFKSILLDTFDLLESESGDNLGLKAKNQLALLQSIIERE